MGKGMCTDCPLSCGRMVQSIPRDPENVFSRTVPIGRFPGSRYSDAVAFPLSQWLQLHDGFNPLTVTGSHRFFTCFPFTRCQNSGTDRVFSFLIYYSTVPLRSVNCRAKYNVRFCINDRIKRKLFLIRHFPNLRNAEVQMRGTFSTQQFSVFWMFFVFFFFRKALPACISVVLVQMFQLSQKVRHYLYSVLLPF